MNDEETQASFDFMDDTATIDFSSLTGTSGGYTWNNMSYTIPTTSLNITNSAYTVNSTVYSNSSGLVVTGDADFKGDVKIDGRSVRDSLAEIEKRLSILVPDPKKLEKYEALRKAYEHYKTIEAICYGDDNE